MKYQHIFLFLNRVENEELGINTLKFSVLYVRKDAYVLVIKLSNGFFVFYSTLFLNS